MVGWPGAERAGQREALKADGGLKAPITWSQGDSGKGAGVRSTVYGTE